MNFKKAKQNRIFQDIVDQVEQAVVTGELTPGEKLPPERELCSLFNTSRGTLREALRILEQKKLIDIKLGAGGGAIVRAANSELIGDNLSLLIRGQQISSEQMKSFSADIAGLLATLAATRAGSDDVGPLKQLVARLTEIMDEQKGGKQILFLMDSLLFEELTRIADNPLYAFLLQAALEIIGRTARSEIIPDETIQNQYYQEIRMIVYAIAQNNQKQARLLTRRHILGLMAQTA
ncbi:MAG TPA: FadR family transcriptional regulator [Desulfobulbaceae bacterium]|nr:FadR family transcriptional regulator [Desulfobulbaceae bacterium]